MLDAISATHIALLQDQLRLETISQNISNMQTPAYKRLALEALNFEEQLQPEKELVRQHMRTLPIETQGVFIQTKHPCELALVGEGYFEVQTPKGIFYTRKGDFHVNEHGELATPSGALLLGNAGTIPVQDKEFIIDKSGNIYLENQKIDQLRIVNFDAPEHLNYLGQGLYQSSETAYPIDQNTQVLQGHLEQSNVKSIDEMMNMVKTSRHFEASQKVMHIADSMLSAAINQLGDA